ncbi:thyroid receptor-interacting protein 11 isoform X2 [Pyxicephalus adspersus]|uniref:thyroid receptor-interacting protein 11 isoform X2 n=1 Tax=Pyxicephalus adspersus TaxID=30357 RepID=UPI003B5C880B
MASWLGGLGSGLGQSLGQVGGSLSSLTGQISNFTKDMLLEGAEETEVGSEVQTSNLQAMMRSENDRLKKLCTELEEKLEASELQVKQQSVDFRNRIQQKEVEISHLKAKLNSLQDEVQKAQVSAQLSSATLQAADSPAFMSSIPPPSSSFQGDDMDFNDVIWSQQEINNLSSEVARLQTEVTHWKHIAQATKAQGTQNPDSKEVGVLQNTIKELKEKLGREIDEHQHELSVLQDAHRQKLAEITRRHREELGEYEERIEELEEQLNAGGDHSDHSKMPELQKTIHILEGEKADSTQKIQELERQLRDLISAAEEEKTSLREEKATAENERNQLAAENERLSSELTELRTPQESDSGTDVTSLQQEVLRLQEALIDAEKQMSTSTDQGLLGDLNRTTSSPEAEITCEQLRRDLEESQRRLEESIAEKELLTTELEELDRQNQEAMQHLLLMKEQLSKQRSESEVCEEKLNEELQQARERDLNAGAEIKKIHEHLQSEEGKLKQANTAFTNLQASERQLTVQINELQETVRHLEATNSNIQKENAELQESLKQSREELGEAQRKSHSLHELQNQDVREEEINRLNLQLSDVRQLKEDLEKEICDLKMENEMLLSTQEQAKLQLQDVVALNSTENMEKQTVIEALRMEKSRLETELNRLENRLHEQAQKYEQTICELSNAQKMDTSALQLEHERLVKLNQEKDFQLAESKRAVEQLEIDYEETKEMLTSTLEGQKQLTELIKEKESFVAELKEKNLEVQRQLEQQTKMTKEFDVLKQSMEEKEKLLASMKEDNSHLKEEIERLKDQQSRSQPAVDPKTLDIITELEAEITQLTKVQNNYEEELKLQKKVVEKQNQNTVQLQKSLQEKIKEVNEITLQHTEMVDTYEKLLAEKDSEISSLQQTNELISSQLQNEHLIQTDSSVILHDTKAQTINNGDNGTEKHDLSKVEIERLVKGIKEKEMEIKILNEKNVNLTKQIDQLSKDEVGKLTQIIQQKDLEIQNLHAHVSSVNYMQDVVYLQQQLQAYAMEREQVLAVLSEKTRENSQLRTDYHKIMDVVAAKESALLKLQDENKRLSQTQDGSNQEMFRETIQNLSRIIRERDIEIDALTQKCQTLLTVLQTSGSENGSAHGSINSNQFEELLQERDKLKQQVKKMEEWKQQVITTVQNMQHESAHLHEELHKLQGQINMDNDSSSKLQVDYSHLIQSYENNEKKLKGLSLELSNVQSSIGELNSTKERLLGQLQVGKISAIPAESPSGGTIEQKNGDFAKLVQECEQLRIRIQEQDATIRTLQENNQRLSDSMVKTSEEGRRSQEETTLELRQIKERNELMQKSLKEKDILIKTKGDKLNSTSDDLRNKENENELLKQAVTNLKERALILEMDISKLKQENERVVAKEKEKETEFRALQETNMQFSLLLREKEFESSSMKEKASALENLLKEKEQGKTGELNQLLNEVKSMQEKAVLFQHERDQVMLALKQKQMETSALQNELQHLRDKAARLNQELERLRNHLLEIEDSYTREAVAAGDREMELRKKVTMLEDKLLSSSTAVETASHQATMQVESLQEQLNLVSRQRDEALIQLTMSQEQVKQYALSLTNLQMVLEQFQQEEKAMYSAELDKHKKQNTELQQKLEKMQDKAVSLQEQLEEANTALESASRLTEQLDLKEELIEELKRQADLKQEMLEDAQNKLMNLLNSTEGKVDKLLMRNLFVGHFHTPKNKRHEVLRLMGSILGLKKNEVDELLVEENRGVTRWVTGWLGGGSPNTKSVPNTPQRPSHLSMLNNSFSELFVKFLETESLPKPPALRMTMHDMAPLGASSGTQSTSGSAALPGSGPSRRQDSNPFLAPRSAAVPLISTASMGGGNSGHLLMKPISDSLPTFTPLPVSSDASAGAVLKDLLKQ